MNVQQAVWRGTAELASKEMDSKKLAVLVDQLCKELDQQMSPVTTVRPMGGD
jgi:hypothetical protein